MDVIVALLFDYCCGTARFLNVKNKASSNAFQYIATLIPTTFGASVLVIRFCEHVHGTKSA